MTQTASNSVDYVGQYHSFGTHDDVQGEISTDKRRANTKVEDDDNLLNEGKRFRHLEYAVFLTPDPLEYIDGPNPYIYCVQNPWGKWDPEGLAIDVFWDIANIIYDAGAAIYNHAKGDHKTAQSHWVDAGYDTAAAIVPGVPAGLSKIKNAGKALDKAKDVSKGAEKVAEATTKETGKAAAKTAKETAENLTKESKFASEDSVKNAMNRGRESEKRVLDDLGIKKNTEKFSTSQGNVIPDSHPNPGRVVEVKDTKNVSNTRQIRGEKELANREGGKLEIHTGEKTNVSKNAQKNATVIRRKDLGPKKNE